MLYILYGLDSYSCREELQKIKNSLGDLEILSVNTSTFKASEITLGQILEVCQLVPFMNKYRLIIVEGLLELFEPDNRKTGTQPAKKHGKQINEWTLFIDFINQMPESTVLILIDEKISLNNLMLKHLRPFAEVKTFPLLNDQQLIKWITNRVKTSGGSINIQSIRLLVEYCSNNLWLLSNEIDKLLSYTAGREISSDDIMKLTCYAREASIFHLVDAVFENKIEQTYRILQKLIVEGTGASYIIAMIARQLRLIIKAKYLDSSKEKERAMEKLNITSEFVLNKTVNLARKYSIDQLKEFLRRLLQADVDIKTGKHSEEVEIDLLMADLCNHRS